MIVHGSQCLNICPSHINYATCTILLSFADTGPSAPPTNLTVNVTSSQSAFIAWDLVPLDQQNGIIVSYTVSLTLKSSGRPQLIETTETSLRVASLLPYETYLIGVRAATIAGEGPYTNLVSITTPEDG